MSTSLLKSGSPVLFSLALCLGAVGSAMATTTPLAISKTSAAKVTHAVTTVKPKHHTHHAVAGRHSKSFLIPPPPAYMPSILPELLRRPGALQTADAQTGEAEKKPENPYKKYVHTPEGSAPEPVQVRKGVVTWTQRY